MFREISGGGTNHGSRASAVQVSVLNDRLFVKPEVWMELYFYAIVSFVPLLTGDVQLALLA
jgi:hypothetical protein